MPAEFRRAEDGREGRGAARLELSTTCLYAQCGIVRARSACGEEAQGRARPGCQLRQGKGPPTDRPTRVAPYPEGREGEKGKDADGRLSSPIMHTSHSSGPSFSTDIVTPEDLI